MKEVKCGNCDKYFQPYHKRSLFCNAYCKVMGKTKMMDSGCCIFMGSVNKNGSGVTTDNNRTVLAHRVVWEYHNGVIPKEYNVLHTCRNGNCVTVEHLYLHSPQEKEQKKRDIKMCTKDLHLMTTENTKIIYFRESRHVRSRKCIQCIVDDEKGGLAKIEAEEKRTKDLSEILKKTWRPMS